jgi:tetratricopeptide (TPR) repeat protein
MFWQDDARLNADAGGSGTEARSSAPAPSEGIKCVRAQNLWLSTTAFTKGSINKLQNRLVRASIHIFAVFRISMPRVTAASRRHNCFSVLTVRGWVIGGEPMSSGRLLQFLGWGIVARALIVAAPVVAQTQQASQQSQDWAWCKGSQESGVSVDRQIQGCTALTQTKGLSPADLAAAYNARSVAYYQSGEYDPAIGDIDQAIRIYPKLAKAYYNRGIVDRAKGDLDKSLADFSDAIRLDPKYVKSLNNRGLVYDAKGDYDRAITDFNEAIRLDPKYVFALNNRGLAYEVKTNYDHAIADFSEAVRLDPKYLNAFYNRSQAYKSKGDADHASADYQQVLQLNPSLAPVLPQTSEQTGKTEPIRKPSPQARHRHWTKRTRVASSRACPCRQDLWPWQSASGYVRMSDSALSPRTQPCLCIRYQRESTVASREHAQSRHKSLRRSTRTRFLGCKHLSSRILKRSTRSARHARRLCRHAATSIYRDAPNSIYHPIVAGRNAAQIVLAAATNDSPVLSSNGKLINVVQVAQASQSFSFPDSGAFGPARSVQSVKTLAGEELSGANLNRLRERMFAPESYVQVPGLQKSCPFEPSIGFQFATDEGEAWWLVSDFCETGMLVAKADDWRRTSPVNIRHEAVRAFIRFGGMESLSPSEK